MYIISKFSDYYDPVAAQGIDKTIIYHRNTETIRCERPKSGKHPQLKLPNEKRVTMKSPSPRGDYPSSMERCPDYNTGPYIAQKWIIGFCGELFPVIKISPLFGSQSKETRFFFDKDKLNQHLQNLGIDESVTAKRYTHWDSVLSEQGRTNIFDKKQWGNLSFIFQEFKTPIFIFGESLVDTHISIPDLILNPKLKDLDFVKMKDPFSAFQDIQSYISGVLGTPARPMVQVSDKIKAASRGHDGEYSFKRVSGRGGKGTRWR